MAKGVRFAAVPVLIYHKALGAVTVVVRICVLTVLLTSMVPITPVLVLWNCTGRAEWGIPGPAHCLVISFHAQHCLLNTSIWVGVVRRAE